MDPRHRRLAEIALAAAGEEHGLALAGGYAVQAHGMGERPSADVDLFTDWQRRADFPGAVDLVVESLRRAGFTVTIDIRAETFARLLVAHADDSGDRFDKVEIAADWRSHPPVRLDVGSVLHPDDAVANKMAALYGRGQSHAIFSMSTRSWTAVATPASGYWPWPRTPIPASTGRYSPKRLA